MNGNTPTPPSFWVLPPDNRPDFWVKIQVGGKEDIEKSVYLSEDAATYEDIGDTRLSTEVILHQIGWYNPNTGEGRLDPREQLANVDDDRAQHFQTGAKQPGAEWEPWYVCEYVSGARQVVLADGRVYTYTDAFDGSDADDNGIPGWVYPQRPTPDDPDGQLNPNLETYLIEGYYVLIPVTADGGAHRDLDVSASGWIDDLYEYNWSAGEYVFEQNLAVDYDGDDDTATKLIPINHDRQADVRTDLLRTASEYLGTYRDYWSTFWTGWYKYDSNGRFSKGIWYSHKDIYGSGSTDKSYKCVNSQWQFYLVYWRTRYQFEQYSSSYAHYGSSRNFSSTWDHVAWAANNAAQQWDQVAVDYHWQYRGHLKDDGYVVKRSGDYNDTWQPVLQWTNTVSHVPYTSTPPDYSNESYAGRPTSDYYRVDEFEDRYHYGYQLNYNHHDIRDVREHRDYQVVSDTRPLYESPSVITSTLQVTAGAQIRLNTNVEQIAAAVTGSGDVTIREADGVTLKDIMTQDGSTAVNVTTATGEETIRAIYVESLTDKEGNGIALVTQTGDVLIDHVQVGKTHGVIALAAASGAIREADVTDADDDVIGNYCFYNALTFGSDDPDLNLETDLNQLIALNDDAYIINKDRALNIAAPGVLANDSDLLTVASIDTTGTIGQVTFSPDGSFSYDPNGQYDYLVPGETAVDSFTYQVSIDNITVDGGTVKVTVTEGLLLEGNIYDGPIAAAVVTGLVNGQVVAGPVFSDQNGEFILIICPEELPADASLLIVAIKADEGIRLMSLTPTITELEALAGTGGTLSYRQVPELIVSNITSVFLP